MVVQSNMLWFRVDCVLGIPAVKYHTDTIVSTTSMDVRQGDADVNSAVRTALHFMTLRIYQATQQ
jgi:hypothetical protein